MASNTKGPVTAEPENLIADFLQKFIKPFLRSADLNNSPSMNRTVKLEIETKILRLIKRKLIELKSLVQDDDEMIETEDNLTLHGNDETTLIEFLPKTSRRNKNGSEQHIMLKPVTRDPLKKSINKYKVLREQIKVMLDEEKITDDKKTLILTTLDEIIAKLIESQCTWMPDKKLSIFRNDTTESIRKLSNMTKKQWKHLRHRYMDYLTNRKEKENAFMNNFHQFFSSVINDTYNLSERYRIRCQLLQLNSNKIYETKQALREKKVVEKPKCENFKVCTNELREFFIDFYNYLNDTGVSVFKNYASMYIRDVNVELGVDKDVVVSVINSLGNKAERKINKVYKSELQRFNLDPDKNKNSNIKHIRDFIKDVVSMAKNILKAYLVKELGAMKTKLFMTVQEDLAVNLEVDMENLERHYLDMICTSFVLCNGRYSARKSGDGWTFRPRSNSEVFVKVQLSLDEEMKEIVARSGLLQYFKKPSHAKYKLNRDFRRAMNSNVTRTSITSFNITRTPKPLLSTATINTGNGSHLPK
ncbi:unnamed protein product [Arctia plantaginis]|uniref:Uncharacterized protein n=1 Tax=Arctia plantaginis TaxID=874455 RepID=A0A8S1B4Z5_ARCPL|nr:unnamed protein product [Arctia plantaginis]